MKLELIIVSGLSGAGKSVVLRCFEDIGFFCVDNLLPPLLPKFIELCDQQENEITRVALGIDIRNRGFLDTFIEMYNTLLEGTHQVELLFIEARDEILVRRFSESRRPHPLGRGRAVEYGIAEEKEKLSDLRDIANQIIDTSDLSLGNLKKKIVQDYVPRESGTKLHISLVSFGFKYGVPHDLDMLFDVRFLRNPYFERELRFQTGHDKPVQNFVYSQKESELFVKKFIDLLDLLVPLYEASGKSYLTVGIGCTGGKHRSVAIVNLLNEVLLQKGLEATYRDRDIHHNPAV
ncbi:MAG: RNase adapter RapZ [Nitrospirota bacterium]